MILRKSNLIIYIFSIIYQEKKYIIKWCDGLNVKKNYFKNKVTIDGVTKITILFVLVRVFTLTVGVNA